jgi:hypothetical protein
LTCAIPLRRRLDLRHPLEAQALRKACTFEERKVVRRLKQAEAGVVQAGAKGAAPQLKGRAPEGGAIAKLKAQLSTLKTMDVDALAVQVRRSSSVGETSGLARCQVCCMLYAALPILIEKAPLPPLVFIALHPL